MYSQRHICERDRKVNMYIVKTFSQKGGRLVLIPVIIYLSISAGILSAESEPVKAPNTKQSKLDDSEMTIKEYRVQKARLVGILSSCKNTLVTINDSGFSKLRNALDVYSCYTISEIRKRYQQLKQQQHKSKTTLLVNKLGRLIEAFDLAEKDLSHWFGELNQVGQSQIRWASLEEYEMVKSRLNKLLDELKHIKSKTANKGNMTRQRYRMGQRDRNITARLNRKTVVTKLQLANELSVLQILFKDAIETARTEAFKGRSFTYAKLTQITVVSKDLSTLTLDYEVRIHPGAEGGYEGTGIHHVMMLRRGDDWRVERERTEIIKEPGGQPVRPPPGWGG